MIRPSTYVARISWRRYTVQVLLTLLAVYVSNFLVFTLHPTLCLWARTPALAMTMWFASQVADTFSLAKNPPSLHYCMATTTILLYLREAVKVIGRLTLEQNLNFSRTQHNTIHFALAFLVLSELQFYRQYIHYRGLKDYRTALIWGPLLANVHPSFKVNRDPFSYILTVPVSTADTESNGYFATLFSRSVSIHVLRLRNHTLLHY
jgi:hypothetical protein